MKRYVPIIIGIVALCAVLYAGNTIMNNRDGLAEEEENVQGTSSTFTGQVVRMFEGENILEYGFDIPEGATTTVEKDGALIKVIDSDALLVAMYASYEGGRGYSPTDYIKNVIVPSVPSVTMTGTTTVGLYDWNVAESARSTWHVAQVGDGSWLLVVENKKIDSEKAQVVIESISTK